MTGLAVLRGLSLTQPWASLVALGHKRVETRSWTTKYRGFLAIHASKGFPLPAHQFAEDMHTILGTPRPLELPTGAVVAVAKLRSVMPTVEAATRLGELEISLGDYGPDRYAWLLDEVRVLPRPILCKGSLGLWQLTNDVHRRIVDALA